MARKKITDLEIEAQKKEQKNRTETTKAARRVKKFPNMKGKWKNPKQNQKYLDPVKKLQQ